jgi:tetratricopeptide (TPR) repeat protein
MQPGHTLFQLIATLSPSEKRHFRIFAGRHVIGEENSYLDLFDAISTYLSAENTDAALFLQAHAQARFAGNFTYNAHYLYQLLLRSLQAFHYENTPARKLHGLLDKAEILLEKQLHDLADKLLRRLQKEATALEEWTILLQALQVRRKLLRKQGEKGVWQDLPAINQQIAHVVQQLASEAAVTECYDEVFLVTQNKVHLSREAEAQAFQSILSRPILQDEAQVTTFNGHIAWHFIHAFIHSLHGRHAQALPHYRRLVQIWDAHPRHIALNPERYALTIIDMLNCCHSLDQYQDFDSGLKAIRNLRDLPPAAATRIHWVTANLEILYYLNTLRLDLAAEVVQGWERVLLVHAEKVSDTSILSYTFNIMLLYFVKEDFSTALKWLNRILNHPRTPARDDVQRFARTFYLVLQIELDNLELLDTELATTRRALQQSGINELETALLTHLGKLIRRPRSEWRKYWERFLGTLGELGQSGVPYFGLQELQIWARSRMMGRSIREQLAGSS